MKESVLKRTSVEDGADLRAGVRDVTLVHFRNYVELRLTLSEGFNIVTGENAQGKTNLLEALYLIGSTRLLRGVRDREAIMQDQVSARVVGSLLHQSTEVEIRLETTANKSAYLNGMKLPRTADLLGRLPCVSISSVDLSMVQGEPAERRLFLDLELSQHFPSYLRSLSLYKKSLEHRNALLKRAREAMVDSRDFEPWEIQLAQSGAELRRARSQFLAELGPKAQEVQASLGGGEELGVRYAPKDSNSEEEGLLYAFERARPDDIIRGTTSLGPHRDDVHLEIEGLEARLYGSQGQQRTAVMSLKLGTLTLSRSRGVIPLLLLDDMLSDLDETRRRRLTEWVLEHAGQAVLTCTEPTAAGEGLISRSQVFRVVNGTVDAL